jgi:TrmH family RNA methyltransferase
MITSAQNPKIKRVRLLISQAKARRKQSAYVLEGVRLLEEALGSNQAPELVLYTPELEDRGWELVNAFRTRGVDCEEVSPLVFNSTSDTQSPQGVLAIYPQHTLPLPAEPDFLVVADALRDPGNLGTLMRTCLAAGVEGLLLAPGTVDPFAPKVIRAGMGAHFRLPLLISSWEEIRRLTTKLQIFIAEMKQGSNLWDADLTRPLVIIIGGEAHGPGRSALQLGHTAIHIPMEGGMESLNAAAAGAVLLYEVRRQRSLVKKHTRRDTNYD